MKDKILVGVAILMYVLGGIITLGGLYGCFGFEKGVGTIAFGVTVVAIGISMIGIIISLSSDIRMKALTNLNFDEKMAMMATYKNTIADMKDEKIKIEDIKKNKERIENMINNEKSIELYSLIEDKKWINQRDIIKNGDWLGLKQRENKLEKDMSLMIERCGYDLSAISNLKTWATEEKKVELIVRVIGVITSAKAIDTCGNNREGICKMIKISLEIDPENVDLQNCYNENRCSIFENEEIKKKNLIFSFFKSRFKDILKL